MVVAPVKELSPDHDHEQTLTARLLPAGSAAGARLELVVMSGEGGSVTYSLPTSGEIVIGRMSTCDVRIEDGHVSRKHALLRIGARVELVDLGSANGTRLGDQRLGAHEARVVTQGETIVFGSTVAILRQASEKSIVRRVWTHAHFEARLEDECARAAARGGEFAVIRVRFGDHDGVTSRMRPTLDSWMRPKDIVAAYSPYEWEFLLLDVGPSQVEPIIARAREEFERFGVPFEVGVATYPISGRTREKLIAAAGPFKGTSGASDVRAQGGFLATIRPTLERVASGTISVLVTGETGAGKEVLAQVLHRLSPRANAPLVCLNCAAFSEALLESELFGHERGAFTGATQSKPGLFETAEGGTVFLDEVGEMPGSLQAKLLRVIEERKAQRVGGLKPRPIDVRFVSATNRDLEAEVARGSFRQDLYYRLNGIVLTVPPLRARRDEIEPLARSFIEQFAAQLGGRSPRLAPEVVELFQSYAWPGNIRELRNTIERAMLLCTGDVITLEHVPYDRMVRPKLSRTIELKDSPVPSHPYAADVTGEPLSQRPPVSRPEPLSQSHTPATLDRERIVTTLEACAGNQTQAAKLLGISRNTLIARLNAYDLARPRKRRNE